MSYLVTDIETVPDLELWTPPSPEEIQADQKAKALVAPPQAQKPIVIGCLWLDDNFNTKKIGVIGAGKSLSEKELLTAWNEFMEKEKPTLITWNGRSFDIPVLVLRSFRNGVPLGWYFNHRNYRYRYSDEKHADLLDIMSEYGAVNKKGFKLDSIAKAIGLPGKYGVDGSMVTSLYMEERIEEIRTYCTTDVIQTAFVFLRWIYAKGKINIETLQRSGQGIIEEAEKTQGLQPFLKLIDRKILLLQDR